LPSRQFKQTSKTITMNSKDQVRFDALKGASSFGVNNAGDFKLPACPPPVKAKALFAALGTVADGEEATTKDTVLGNLVRAIKTQDSGKGDFHGGTASKGVQREGLLEMLRNWNRTADAIATATSAPQIMESFRMPRGNNDTELAARARAFADAAGPLKAEFLALAHPADFIEALRQRITDFEEAADEQSTGLQDRAGATAGITDLVEQGLVIHKQLNAIMHNLYAATPQKLAAWLSASNIPRSPSSAKEPAAGPAHPAAAPRSAAAAKAAATLGSEVPTHSKGNGTTASHGNGAASSDGNGNETNGSGATPRLVANGST